MPYNSFLIHLKKEIQVIAICLCVSQFFSKQLPWFLEEWVFLLFSSKGKPRDDKVSFHTLYRRCTLYIFISSRYPPDAPRPWIAGPRSGEQELLIGQNWAQPFRTSQFCQLVHGAFEAYRWYHFVFECFLFVETHSRFLSILHIYMGRCRTNCVQQGKC